MKRTHFWLSWRWLARNHHSTCQSVSLLAAAWCLACSDKSAWQTRICFCKLECLLWTLLPSLLLENVFPLVACHEIAVHYQAFFEMLTNSQILYILGSSSSVRNKKLRQNIQLKCLFTLSSKKMSTYSQHSKHLREYSFLGETQPHIYNLSL